MNDDLVHYFIPAVRQGLAAQIRLRNKQAKKAHRATLALTLTVKGQFQATSSKEDIPPVDREVSLYGPGDVLGFDSERIVARTDPKPDVGDFEPNYFPCIEFAEADFPWRFTADEYAANRLDPWIVLVVLAGQDKGEVTREFEDIRARDPKLPRRIVVKDARKSLPDLSQAWRWAHVRVTAQSGLTTAQVEELILNQPGQAVSVLHCPRRLAPGVQYSAFVVPAFRLGREAALGQPLTPNVDASDPAWSRTEAGFELPYYHRWDFGTGKLGDFERLVRLLEPRELTQLGTRPIDCSSPGYDLSGVRRSDVDDEEGQRLLDMEGALQSLDTQYTPWGYDAPPEGPPAPNDHQPPNAFQVELAKLLNRPNTEDLAAESRDVMCAYDAASSIDKERITWNYSLLDNRLLVAWEAGPATNATFKFGEPGQELQLAATIGQSATLDRLIPERDYQFEILTSGKRAGGTIRIVLPQVVPPAYGRWHFGELKSATPGDSNKTLIVNPGPEPSWLEELNLDPRHRAAAGLGAEVVRKNQEALMASAWGQLGEIERANDILRRAQLGRDSGWALHKRLGHMGEEHLLRFTRAAQKVVFFEETASPRTQRVRQPATAATYLGANTRIAAAALDPAFRRIASPRRAIRARQLRKAPADRGGARAAVAWPEGMLLSLLTGNLEAAGPARKPLGLASIEEVTKALVSRSSPPGPEPGARGNHRRAVAEGEQSRRVTFGEHGITGTLISEALDPQNGFLAGLPNSVKGVLENPEIGPAVVDAFKGWLGQDDFSAQAPKKDARFLKEFKGQVLRQLDPHSTILERTKSRLRFAGAAQHHFQEGKRGDPLDPILWAPAFEYPMYEPLLELGHTALLPGVEKIPQNTIGVLKANRRFIEAYLAGCNHEFAGELLWRGYPTDQRGTYFRQFWDVSEYLSSPKEELEILESERQRHGNRKIDDMPMSEKYFILASDLGATEQALSAFWAMNATSTSPDEEVRRKRLLQSIEEVGADALPSLTPGEVTGAVVHVLIDQGLRNKLHDIRPITQWPAGHRLGANGMNDGGGLILVIRGDLLKRYPGALIYAVDEVEIQVGTEKKKVPGLEDLVGSGQPVPDRIYPVFRATMPPDLTFFGLPPDKQAEEAGAAPYSAKYFVIEQAPGEPRHGLDEPESLSSNPPVVSSPDEMTWATFGFQIGANSRVGAYLDDPSPDTGFPRLSGQLLRDWTNGTSAHRALETWQKPVRIVVHAKQLLPAGK